MRHVNSVRAEPVEAPSFRRRRTALRQAQGDGTRICGPGFAFHIRTAHHPPQPIGSHARHDLRPERPQPQSARSEEHTSELQSLMRISYAVFCLKKKNKTKPKTRQQS